MVRLGWLADHVGIIGGAEISGGILLQHVPEGIEVVPCQAERRPPAGIDAWMLQNTVTYDRRWIDVLVGKPLIKHFRDPWHPGDIVFRRWVLDHATHMIFNSQLAVDTLPWVFDVPYSLVPPPVDLARFRAAARPPTERYGNVFVGRVDLVKGAHIAIDWALRHNEPLDLYGQVFLDMEPLKPLPSNIRLHGLREYARLPEIFGAARRFVFFPAAVESYSRTTVEAWAAGCELVIDASKIGAAEWLQKETAMIDMHAAVARFWTVVTQVLERG